MFFQFEQIHVFLRNCSSIRLGTLKLNDVIAALRSKVIQTGLLFLNDVRNAERKVERKRVVLREFFDEAFFLLLRPRVSHRAELE